MVSCRYRCSRRLGDSAATWKKALSSESSRAPDSNRLRRPIDLGPRMCPACGESPVLGSSQAPEGRAQARHSLRGYAGTSLSCLRARAADFRPGILQLLIPSHVESCRQAYRLLQLRRQRQVLAKA